MARVSVQQIEEYLDRFGWTKHLSQDEPDELEGLVRTGWTTDDVPGGFMMTIDPMIEKGILAFRVSRTAEARPSATPPDRLRDVMLVLNHLNYRMSLGKWAMDVRDGEIVFRHYVAIDDGLPYERFERHLTLVAGEVSEGAPVLRGIIDGTLTARMYFEREEIIVG